MASECIEARESAALKEALSKGYTHLLQDLESEVQVGPVARVSNEKAA